MKIINRNKLQSVIVLTVLALLCIAPLYGQMRDITAHEIVTDMRVGWNLGNNFDSLGGDETAWGNPTPTRGLIIALRDMGFKTIRIPVSWGEHVGAGPGYTIDPVRLNKVEDVVNWVLDSGMYAIVNMHHDNAWLIPTYANETAITAKFVAIWTQIANRFRDYNDYLLLELMNEPRVENSVEEWNGGTAENRDVINHLNQAGLNTIRGTGGNNSSRFVLLATHAATTLNVAIRDFVVPNDTRIIISQHTYFPYAFCFETGGSSTWGSNEDKLACDIEADRIRDFWDAKFVPVIVGEWGAVNKNNTADRIAHAQYYANAVRTRGMLPIWWDNGYPDVNQFGLINRSTYDWYFPQIAQAVINGAGSADSPPIPTTSPFPGYNCSTIPAWAPETIYADNDMVVSHNGKVYSNRWWSMGDNPEDSVTDYDVWKFIGNCSSALTPTPYPGNTTPGPTNVQTPVPTIEPTVISTVAPTQEPLGATGDVNHDGAINIVDALLTAQYYVNLNPENFDPSLADTDCDGEIDIVDALLIAQYYVDLITEFC